VQPLKCVCVCVYIYIYMQMSEDKKFPILLLCTAFREDVLKDTVPREQIRQTVFLLGMSLLVLFRGYLTFRYECQTFRL